MKINKLEFKNINSYGNKKQEIVFGDNDLILFQGDNGAGKSTVKQAIELCYFGKVQGRTGKRLSLDKLPNRKNHSLYTGIYFKNKKEITIKRWIKPNKFEMFVDNEDYTEKFKKMNQKQRDELIGLDFNIFKSFFSLNMNDFKNFTSLQKSDKDVLLDKLFNLEKLNVLYSICNDTKNNSSKNQERLDNEIEILNDNIDDFQEILNKNEINKEEKLNNIKNQINSVKPQFKELENQIKKLEEEEEKLNKKLKKLYKIKNDKINEKTKLEITNENLNENINYYKSGSCPICKNNLLEQQDQLESMLLEYDDNKKLIVECDKFLERCILEDAKIRNKLETLYHEKKNKKSGLNIIKNDVSILKNEYNSLKSSSNDSVVDIKDKLVTLKEKLSTKIELKEKLDKKINIYGQLMGLFSIDGIKKIIIKNSLIPINKYLKEYLKELNSEFNVYLDDDFNAKVYELNVMEIDPETLSNGEHKKINLAIALSYLNLILDLKVSNMIFLDEVFDGISVKNIKITLELLKKLTKKHNINIIIVHHGMNKILDVEIFDRIFEFEKDIFSDINETK